MCTLEKLNCKISRGSMPPDPPSLLAPSALDFIWAGLTLNCFRQAGYFQLVTLTMILRILRTQKDVSFLSRKGCTKGLLTRDPLKLKVHPPPPPAEKAAYAPVCQPLLLMLALVSYIIHLVNTLFFISMTMSMKLMEGGSDIIYFRVDQMNSVLIPHQSYPCRPLLLTVTD